MATLPDNRIRLPAVKIDFSADVGVTGQLHDLYPSPSGQARYDHMRMFLIGLLAQQASYSEPTQYRDGTPWFDLNTLCLKIRRNGAWAPISDSVGLSEDSDGNVVTLSDWYTAAQEILVNQAPEVVFSGVCRTDSVAEITIPSSLQASLHSDSRVFLFINGGLVDPRNCSLIGTPATTIRLSGVVLSDGDTFVVSIRRIGATTFLSTTVVVP
jgi:hypothetical protein